MASTNLPPVTLQDSAAATKLFFDTYGEQPLEFNAVDVDACLNFFKKAGFENDAATVVSASILKQAKIENIPVFRILDTLKNTSGLELSAFVAEILNNNRPTTSTIGFRKSIFVENISRNIYA